MSKYVINDTTLTGIGDAIRAKGGTTALIPVTGLADAITNLPTGGGEIEFPAVLDMGLTKINEQGKFDWLWGMAPQMTILHGGSSEAFTYSQLEDLSHLTFKLGVNISSNAGFNNYFNYCQELKALPNIIFLGNKTSNIAGFFSNCSKLREIPNDIFMARDENGESLGTLCFSTDPTTTNCRTGSVFNGCKSLRVHPKIHDGIQRAGNSSNSYTYMFYNCHALDEITDIPVYKGPFTSNTFSNAFNLCHRVENIKFAKQADGTPYTADWKNQTIDLTNYVGYVNYESNITNYNSGITTDNKVSSTSEYNQRSIKNWYSISPSFCRYDLIAASFTLGTLPDTSAYIAANGGTNTIKFRGECGIKDVWVGTSNSVEDFMKNMPDAYIAMATAKGWTVSLV